jgi:hypothetical protein
MIIVTVLVARLLGLPRSRPLYAVLLRYDLCAKTSYNDTEV